MITFPVTLFALILSGISWQTSDYTSWNFHEVYADASHITCGFYASDSKNGLDRGRFWAGTSFGLFVLKQGDSRTGSALWPVTGQAMLQAGYIHDLCQAGRYLAAATDDGLFLLDPLRRSQSAIHLLAGKPVYCLASGQRWLAMGSKGCLYMIHTDEFSRPSFKMRILRIPISNRIGAVQWSNTDSVFLIGTSTGTILAIAPGQTKAKVLTHIPDTVTSLAVSENIYWAGTHGSGVFSWPRKGKSAPRAIATPPSLTFIINGRQNCATTMPDTATAGCLAAGLVQIHGFSVKPLPSLDRWTTLTWQGLTGTYGSGLLNANNKAIKVHRNKRPEWLNAAGADSKDDTTWQDAEQYNNLTAVIISQGSEILLSDRISGRIILRPSGWPQTRILDLAFDEKGLLWAARSDGIFFIESNKRFVPANLVIQGLKKQIILCLKQTRAGFLFGTDKGEIFRLKEGRFTRFARIGHGITALSSRDGTVLAGTPSGLFMINSNGTSRRVSCCKERGIMEIRRCKAGILMAHSTGLLLYSTRHGQWMPYPGKWPLQGLLIRAMSIVNNNIFLQLDTSAQTGTVMLPLPGKFQ